MGLLALLLSATCMYFSSLDDYYFLQIHFPPYAVGLMAFRALVTA
jgi:hypothetical protein